MSLTNGEIWFNYADLQVKNLQLFKKQAEQLEEARELVTEGEFWEHDYELFFDLDPEGYQDYFRFMESERRRVRELERPLFQLFEEDRELVNPTPEDILSSVEAWNDRCQTRQIL